MEIKKTVRLTSDEQEELNSIFKILNLKTENKVFKYLISNFDLRESMIKTLKSEVEKLEFKLEERESQLEDIKEAIETINRFSKLKI